MFVIHIPLVSELSLVHCQYCRMFTELVRSVPNPTVSVDGHIVFSPEVAVKMGRCRHDEASPTPNLHTVCCTQLNREALFTCAAADGLTLKLLV